MRNAMLILVWVLFLACGLAVGVEGADLESGLVAHWKFDETEGTTAHDSSGNGHHGVLNGGAEWSSGYLGGALLFDGEDDEVEVPYNSALLPPDAFTVSAWARPSSCEWIALVSCRGDYDPRGFEISSASGWWSFGIGGDWYWAYTASSPCSPMKWVHLAGVYSEGTQRFYVDGVLVGESSHTLLVSEVQKFLIGAAASEPIPGEFVSGMFFNGRIDEVRLYNRALSEEEVMSLVANDACRASLRAIPWDDPTFISLAFPWNGWRYALELSDTTHGDLVWRRENPTVVPVGPRGGLGWNWEMKKRARMMRVAVESRTPAFGELNVLVNPITTDTELNEGGRLSNVNDDWAFGAGFRPLGTRIFFTDPQGSGRPLEGDHAMWMVKPSGGPYSGGRSPICEVEFEKHKLAGWHLKPKETGYVALGDYLAEEEPPPGSPNRPVAVRSDLVYRVDSGEETVTVIQWAGFDEALLASKRPSVDPAPQDGKLFDPGRFFWLTCITDHLYMLRLPLPQSVRPRRTASELITFGPTSQPNDLSTIYTSHTVTVPYTEVKDPRPDHPREWQRMMSPFYTLEREEAFQLMQTTQNEGTFQYTDTQGTSTEVAQSYWQSSAFTVDLNVGIQVKAVDISGGISVTKEMGWETSQAFSNMREKSVSYSATVQPGEFAGLWFRCYRLIQRDALGEAVNPNPQWMVDPNAAVFTYYPPR